MSDSNFPKWIAKAAESAKARCRLCKKDFHLAKMGINAFESHAKSQKHQRCVKEGDEIAKVFTKTGTKQSTFSAPVENEVLSK